MGRNYANEAAWEKRKYRIVKITLCHDDAEKLDRVIACKDMTISDWFRAKINDDVENRTDHADGSGLL
jgi:hypothetical protein